MKPSGPSCAQELRRGSNYVFAHSQGSHFAYYVVKLLRSNYNVDVKAAEGPKRSAVWKFQWYEVIGSVGWTGVENPDKQRRSEPAGTEDRTSFRRKVVHPPPKVAHEAIAPNRCETRPSS